MGDFNKFQNSFLYYSFYALLICIIASEVFIFLFTYQKGKGKAKKHYYDKDKGTKWLLYINFIICPTGKTGPTINNLSLYICLVCQPELPFNYTR